MDSPLTPQQSIRLIEAFARQNDITTTQLLNLTAKGLAIHLATCGCLTLPIQVGLPSPQCHTC